MSKIGNKLKIMEPCDRLIDLLRNDKVIPVVGAGVSYAAAKLPGWKGTIQNGIQYARQLRIVKKEQVEEINELLEAGRLIEGANIMKKLLNSPGHPFADWLEEFLGNPRIVSSELIDAINNLCTQIIITTNYDTLLYSGSKIKSKEIFDWTEYEEIERALRKNTELVWHAHGIYNKPQTIILSAADYEMLKDQFGYKNLLQKLWSQYHFLFIGCSKDGVMDEDFSTIFHFLNKWFPGTPHAHYILMNEQDIKLGLHLELTKVCNVQVVSYGESYDDLPKFINQINPNWEKMENKYEKFMHEIQEKIENLPQLQGRITASSEVVNKFLRDSLPNKLYWIDSVQLSALENAWKKFNDSINNKGNLFSNYQKLINGLVDISDLRSSIALWNDNRDNPLALGINAFVELAVLSYQCLKMFPSEIMEDIRHRGNTVHDYYFSGYLGSFVEEVKRIKVSGRVDLEDFYRDDKYFFENLKRIISSLEGILSLDSKEIFKELQPAVLTPKVDYPFLVFVAKDNISLRKSNWPFELFASLPGEEALPFRDAKLVIYQDKSIIIGYTSQYCFYWNPIENLSSVRFFIAPIGSAITQLTCNIINNEILIDVFCGSKKIRMKDFIVTNSIILSPRLNQYIFINDLFTMVGKANVYHADKTPFLFLINGDDNITPILTTIELWETIKDLPILKEKLDSEMIIEGISNETNHWIFPFIQNVEISSFEKERDKFILRTEVCFHKSRSTVLVGFRLSENKLTAFCRVCMPMKLCYAYDFVEYENCFGLLCGYFDMGNVKNLVQYIPSLNFNGDTIITNEHSIIESLTHTSLDVFKIKKIAKERYIALQQSDLVHEIKIPELTYRTMNCKGIIKVLASS